MKTIAVLDDDLVVLDILEVALSNIYDVKLFDHPKKLSAYLAQELPDLIVMDYLLHETNGDLMCKLIKENPVTQHIPVIMFSASILKPQVITDAKCDVYIEKPFDLEDLENQIARHIN
ncbi:response regulator [Pedobacter namyangjuensis]|uniref:response regulator n=1 Tax=Pedobacter namyangjuensis TaxID=600626 RepID=UPI000DE341EF|nr:response regulator [Pedobacter namyangjuensis]